MRRFVSKSEFQELVVSVGLCVTEDIFEAATARIAKIESNMKRCALKQELKEQLSLTKKKMKGYVKNGFIDGQSF